MSYNSKELLKDVKGVPIPQEFDPLSDSYKVLARKDLFGKSTDTKPTGVEVGTTFFEIDTKSVYVYDGAVWVAMGLGTTDEFAELSAQLADKASKTDVGALTTSLAEKMSSTNIKNILDYSSLSNRGIDWQPAFTKAFTDLTALGGGILDIPVGTYIIRSTIFIPSKIHVRGQGKGITIIKLDNGCSTDIINLNTSQNCGIRDLTIKGNIFDPNPASTPNSGLVIGRAGLNVATNEGNMPNSYIHNIELRDIVGDGFHCFQNTWVYAITRVDSQFNSGYGFNIESTDNFYDLLTSTGNGKYGIRLTGSNNRLSNMKLIFNGRGADQKGSVGTDFENAGFYSSGKRNTLVNIECQENYGHGFVFDGAIDTDLMGCVSDANGYSMISNNRSATAIGFYFQNCQRMSGSIKSTIFKSTISQASGIYIDASCSNLSFDYENDHTQTENVLSSSAILMTAATKKDMYAATQYTSNHQYNDFLVSGTILNNAITSYDGANLQLSSTMQTSTTIDTVNHEILVTTNWGVGQFPRIGSSYRTTTSGRTYLVRLKVKPTTDNYWLQLNALHDASPYTLTKVIEGYYNSSAYTDLSFTFTAGVSASNFLFYVTDKKGDGTSPNTTQSAFRVKDLAFVDITDALSSYYLTNTLDKAVRDNYFLGSKTFSTSSGSPTAPAIETAWEDWVPALTWTTANPLTVTTRARRKISGKTVFFSIYISCTDGNGATSLTIKPPSDMLPKQNSLYPPFYNTVVIGASTNVNRQVNLRDDANQDINFGFLGTATAGQILKIYFQGFYELA